MFALQTICLWFNICHSWKTRDLAAHRLFLVQFQQVTQLMFDVNMNQLDFHLEFTPLYTKQQAGFGNKETHHLLYITSGALKSIEG